MNRKNRKNIYLYTLLKYLLALGILFLMQILFYACNTRIFHLEGWQESMGVVWGNVVFGFATISLFLAPFCLLMLLPFKIRWKKVYRIIAEILYILPVLIIIVTRGANAAYYQYTYRLLSDEIFSYLGISGQMGALAPLFAKDYWYAWVFPLLIAILFFILNSRIRLAEAPKYRVHPANSWFAFIIGIALVGITARGVFTTPIATTDAARYCQPKNTALVSNDAYNIFRTMLTPDIEEKEYMTTEEAEKIVPTIHTPTAFSVQRFAAEDSIGAKRRNVMLIVVESLGQEFMGCYNTQADADTRTPFLDSLARISTVYDGRSNGKKSIEGITAINTSIPNLMSVPFTNSAYAKDSFIGLPTILKKHGYRCAFFHGSYNGVMNFDSTCMRIGFDEYLGKNEYEAWSNARPTDYDGVWGIFDEPFLRYTAEHIGTFNEPFFAEVFTVTSHHPFPIPEEHKGRFVEGRHPILKCVEYTDYSLRQFFEEAEKQPWYENTLFIITGDHSGHGLTPEYNDYDGWYRIPMIVFDPQHREGKREKRIVQQIDLFPTIVDYLGFDDSFVCFGQSIYKSPQGWQVYYGNGYYVMVSDSPIDSTHNITTLMGDKATGKPEDIRFLEAFIRQYNDRLINDKLILK